MNVPTMTQTCPGETGETGLSPSRKHLIVVKKFSRSTILFHHDESHAGRGNTCSWVASLPSTMRSIPEVPVRRAHNFSSRLPLRPPLACTDVQRVAGAETIGRVPEQRMARHMNGGRTDVPNYGSMWAELVDDGGRARYVADGHELSAALNSPTVNRK